MKTTTTSEETTMKKFSKAQRAAAILTRETLANQVAGCMACEVADELGVSDTTARRQLWEMHLAGSLDVVTTQPYQFRTATFTN